MLNAAIVARENAYSRYSNFKVGCAIRLADNQIVTGCNVENSSFGATICAERNAFSAAIAKGHRTFVAVAVVAFQEESFTSPCGICRQFMSEFAKTDIPVYLAKPALDDVLMTSIYQLLPHRFILNDGNEIDNNN